MTMILEIFNQGLDRPATLIPFGSKLAIRASGLDGAEHLRVEVLGGADGHVLLARDLPLDELAEDGACWAIFSVDHRLAEAAPGALRVRAEARRGDAVIAEAEAGPLPTLAIDDSLPALVHLREHWVTALVRADAPIRGLALAWADDALPPEAMAAALAQRGLAAPLQPIPLDGVAIVPPDALKEVSARLVVTGDDGVERTSEPFVPLPHEPWRFGPPITHLIAVTRAREPFLLSWTPFGPFEELLHQDRIDERPKLACAGQRLRALLWLSQRLPQDRHTRVEVRLCALAQAPGEGTLLIERSGVYEADLGRSYDLVMPADLPTPGLYYVSAATSGDRILDTSALTELVPADPWPALEVRIDAGDALVIDGACDPATELELRLVRAELADNDDGEDDDDALIDFADPKSFGLGATPADADADEELPPTGEAIALTRRGASVSARVDLAGETSTILSALVIARRGDARRVLRWRLRAG